MNVVELLQAAKEKINTPEKWCKEEFAKDNRGNPVSTMGPTACQWCCLGALRAVTPGGPFAFVKRASDTAICLISEVAGRDVAEFNDAKSTTHADVMAVFDRAIELAKKEAAHASV